MSDIENQRSWHKAGSLEALKGAPSIRATVEGRKIAIFAVEDGVVATTGRCPHAQGPLHNGEVDGATLTCPWHGWSFNLHSGVCDEDPELFLERFETRVDGDDILVRL